MEGKKYIFKLFLAGLGPEDQQKIVRLKKLLCSEFGDDFSLEVVNVLKHPELAESKKIIATPSLIRELPLPEERSVINLNAENALPSKLKKPDNEEKLNE